MAKADDSEKEDAPPTKATRQEAFVRRCEADDLSAQESVNRASFFPKGVAIKVLSWPKL